jgi:hypothetical protein
MDTIVSGDQCKSWHSSRQAQPHIDLEVAVAVCDLTRNGHFAHNHISLLQFALKNPSCTLNRNGGQIQHQGYVADRVKRHQGNRFTDCKSAAYFDKLKSLLEEYKSVFIVGVDKYVSAVEKNPYTMLTDVVSHPSRCTRFAML